MILWRYGSEKHHAFLGDPTRSPMAAVVYPYEGGFLWEVRWRCLDCGEIALMRTGSARRFDAATSAVEAFMSYIAEKLATPR